MDGYNLINSNKPVKNDFKGDIIIMNNLFNVMRIQNLINNEPCMEIMINEETGVMKVNICLPRYVDKPRISLHPSRSAINLSSRMERSVPHFHIVDSHGNPYPVAIRLCEADYFFHERYKKRLSEVKETRKGYAKILDETLRSPSKYIDGTNWDYLVSLWNDTAKNNKGYVVDSE